MFPDIQLTHRGLAAISNCCFVYISASVVQRFRDDEEEKLEGDFKVLQLAGSATAIASFLDCGTYGLPDDGGACTRSGCVLKFFIFSTLMFASSGDTGRSSGRALLTFRHNRKSSGVDVAWYGRNYSQTVYRTRNQGISNMAVAAESSGPL